MQSSTDLRPEQQIALDYGRRKGTEAPADEIRAKVASTIRDFEALLESIPEAATSERPAPGKWSVHEVVDHLVESNRPAVDQLTDLLAGRSPADAIPAGLQSDEPFARAWPELLAEARSVHLELLEVLGGASDDTSLEPAAPVEMVVKCADASGELRPVHWLQSFDWKAYTVFVRAHVLEHMQQIRRIVGR